VPFDVMVSGEWIEVELPESPKKGAKSKSRGARALVEQSPKDDEMIELVDEKLGGTLWVRWGAVTAIATQEEREDQDSEDQDSEDQEPEDQEPEDAEREPEEEEDGEEQPQDEEPEEERRKDEEPRKPKARATRRRTTRGR
jgi:hypothetical protein